MHDFLTRLIGRATATTEVVRPLSTPVFARTAERPRVEGSVDDVGRERRADSTHRVTSVRPARSDLKPTLGASDPAPALGGEPDVSGPAATAHVSTDRDELGQDSSRDDWNRARPLNRRGPASSSNDEGAASRSFDSSAQRTNAPPAMSSAVALRAADDAEPASDPSERRRHVVESHGVIEVRDESSESKTGRANEALDDDAPATPLIDHRTAARADDAVRGALDARRDQRATGRSAPPPEPVRIEIGRIEVRIATREPERERPGAQATPLVSLDEYLSRQGTQRQGRGGR